MNVGEIHVRAKPEGHVTIRADEQGLDTLETLIRGARDGGWANIETEGDEVLRVERVATGVIPKMKT